MNKILINYILVKNVKKKNGTYFLHNFSKFLCNKSNNRGNNYANN